MVVLPRQLLFSSFWDVSCLFTLVLHHLSPKCLLLDPVCPHLALSCRLDRFVVTIFSSFLSLFWKRILMIQSPNFVHLSNVADVKSAFTVEALKLILVLFLINANFFFFLNMEKSSTSFGQF